LIDAQHLASPKRGGAQCAHWAEGFAEAFSLYNFIVPTTPQSKIGSEMPIFDSPLYEGAKGAVHLCYVKQQFISSTLYFI
jgi:hypothetical protein